MAPETFNVVSAVAPCTVSVLLSVVALATSSVPASPVAPETFSVLLSVVAPCTVSVLLSVAAWATSSVPASPVAPETFTVLSVVAPSTFSLFRYVSPRTTRLTVSVTSVALLLLNCVVELGRCSSVIANATSHRCQVRLFLGDGAVLGREGTGPQ